ncbi:MAG: hypothetical protein HYV17_12945 [Xanthomonadales bacterium]|nr:hypothetical protein [Xanthomonadales bacterium]
MSIVVLLFSAVLLGLMGWSRAVLESWVVVAGVSGVFFVAAILARSRALPRLAFAAAGIIGVLILGVAVLVRLLVHWMNSNVQPLG